MKRYKHSLSHYKLLTGDMGFLYPVACFDVLPGDSVQQSTSLLIRLSPLIAPVMHPITVRVHHWFVPYRLLWDGWEKFITGGTDGLGDGVGSPPMLSTTPEKGPVTKGGFADYIGIPPGFTGAYSAFPQLAMRKIWLDWYADQDFSDPDNIPDPDPYWGLFPIGWEKDYFTTARAWPQKGPEVTVPLGGTAPVVPRLSPDGGTTTPSFRWDNPGGGTVEGGGFLLQINPDQNTNWSTPSSGSIPSQTQSARWGADPGLEANLAQATGANVNDFRRAFAVQRYQEARARYGSRYTEYLAYLGVRSSDARLQRSEFLGGGKQTISFSEVLQTGPGATEGAPVGSRTGVGTMAGHGIAALRSNAYRRFFEEHGVVLSLLSVRPKSMYTQGVHRNLLKSVKEDYWQKELELIGQQEIRGQEVHYADTQVAWGYQDRYSEYKSIPSGIAGDFRDTLSFYHLAREFTAPPALNGQFMACQPSKRIFQEQTTHCLWMMAYNNIQARRMVRRGASSRII